MFLIFCALGQLFSANVLTNVSSSIIIVQSGRGRSYFWVQNKFVVADMVWLDSIWLTLCLLLFILLTFAFEIRAEIIITFFFIFEFSIYKWYHVRTCPEIERIPCCSYLCWRKQSIFIFALLRYGNSLNFRPHFHQHTIWNTIF